MGLAKGRYKDNPVMPDLIRHPEVQYLEKALDSGSSPE
jgi:hypothetical protein